VAEWRIGSGCAEALLIRVHAAKQHVDEQQADWGDWGATRKTLD